MRRRLSGLYFFGLILMEVSGFQVRNKLLGKCLQGQEGASGGRVSLQECDLYLPSQEWLWLPGSQALSSGLTGDCLTAPGELYEGVHLQPCTFNTDSGGTGAVSGSVEKGREARNQKWSCSKKGHLTVVGRGLHLSATQESSLVFLSNEHKQGSRWWTLDNQTLCNGKESTHTHHRDQPHPYLKKSLEPAVFPNAFSNMDKGVKSFEGIMGIDVTESYPEINGSDSSLTTKSPADPTMIFYSLDYGMSWKITMLVLSSLALVLGTVILILNVYSNRRKKVVCVLKSYSPRSEMRVPGSPVPSERAPLTEHAMRLPHSTPTLQRGEILIEWKDGTVTPLYEA